MSLKHSVRVYIYEFKSVEEEGYVRAYLYSYPANTMLHRYQQQHHHCVETIVVGIRKGIICV